VIDGDANPLTKPAHMLTGSGWTGGRILAVVLGGVLSLVALTLIGVGATATYMATSDDGYVDLGTGGYAHSTDTYAMSTDSFRAAEEMGGLYDGLRITFTPKDTSTAVFVGIADKAGAQQYLDGIQHQTIHDSKPKGDVASTHPGSRPQTPPAEADVWLAKADGQGAQTVSWTVQPGDVEAVAMKADGTRGLAGHVDVAAKIAGLTWMGVGSLVVGLLLLAASVLWLVVRPVRRARGRTA
jgi:hypothetical protein